MVQGQTNQHSNHWAWAVEELNGLRQHSLYRALKIVEPVKGGKLRYNDKEILNLCSNNYLGISEELRLPTEQQQDATPVGATASRLIVGNHPSFNSLETTMAELKGTESCLVFSCGYMTNIGTISALVGQGDAIYSDRLNHASIIDGARLSGARHFRYRHNDPEHLKQLLIKSKDFRKRLIITESIFSMDGDQASLEELVDLKEKFNAIIMVDEAHAAGIYGKRGAGLISELGLCDRVDIQMGTFSKAYGCFGGYVAGAKILTDYLINRARSFIFTTGLPPCINSLNQQAVELSIHEDWRRRRLFENAEYFRNGLKKLGLNSGKSTTQIIPLIIGDESRALKLSELLWSKGIAVVAIRPPTVPKKTARLRFSVMATHKKSDLEWALRTIGESVESIPAG